MKKSISIASILCLYFALLTINLSAGDNKWVRLPDEMKIVDAKFIDAQRSFAKSNTAWSKFTASNPTWQVWWDSQTQSPHRAWGEGIQVRGFSHINQSNAADAGWRFVRDHASALNVNSNELRLLQAEEANGKWYYKFKQTYKGLDVLNSFVDLRMMPNGKVFVFGSDFIKGMNVDINPSLSIEAAKEFAKVGLEYKPGTEYMDGGQLYILPLKYDERIDNRLVYNFTIHQSEREEWYTCVDAQNGHVLWRYNLVYDFTTSDEPQKKASVVQGRISGLIYPVSYSKDSLEVPFPNTYINIAGKEVLTDANGNFSVDVGAASTVPVIARLAGPYAISQRADTTTGPNAKINMNVSTIPFLDLKWTNSNSTAPERNAFYHITAAHNFIRNIDTSSNLIDLDKQIPGRVNTPGTCNASWGGSRITFLREDARCGNTALIADVVYHEYGHGINQYYYTKRRGQPMANGALNEATSDINANMLRDDPRIGVGFMKGQPNDGIIRNSDNNLHYPENLVGEIHDDGMILTGAVWDMRKVIGLEAAQKISHFCKYGTPDNANTGVAYADYFFETLTADDDNGNLLDGTPHSALIIPEFLKHGIPTSGIAVSHNAIRDQDGTAKGYKVTGGLTTQFPTNIFYVQGAIVIWSIDNWKDRNEMNLKMATATKFDDTIPAQPAGSIVQYYLRVQDNYGGYIIKPNWAPSQSYIFMVGMDSKMLDKMETDAGWKVNQDNDDNATKGKWIRAVPIGNGAQPGIDHSPAVTDSMCWVTGNAPAGMSPSANDVDSGKTTLQTVTYDLSKYKQPVLRYWRWYSNNQGDDKNKEEWVVQISNDDGKTWKDLERTKESITDWTARAFYVKEYITPTDKVRVRFVASDYGYDSIVEAAVDDFEFLDLNPALSTEPLQSPDALTLHQNYPNPFTQSTAISYWLSDFSHVKLEVSDVLGRKVATLVNAEQEAGFHTANFNISSFTSLLRSGIYFYQIEVNGQRLVKKMMYTQ